MKSFEKLVEIIAELRGPDGCPWDQKQTHESLGKYLQEETQELLDAINKKDTENLKEELGDVLLQIILHAQIASESKVFDINDVINSLNEKLIRRHPHVFGDKKGQVKTMQDLKDQWERIKSEEKSI